jgi:hypothetical protein
MQNFEDIRSWAQSRVNLKDNEAFLLSFDFPIAGTNRLQGMYIAELECEDGSKIARVSTPIAKTSRVNAERSLRFNWAQRVGYLAFGDLDGKEWLHLCENRTYPGLSEPELNRIMVELAPLADKLERALTGADRS